jgi:hypothetical protein
VIAPSPDCSELYFSELTFNKEMQPNGTFELNYSVEIFNPTNATINLGNYQLEVINSNGSSVFIPLNSNIINAHETFVVTNSNSDVTLNTLVDILTQDLRFDNNNITLRLLNNSIIIDQVGENNISIGGFDAMAFQNSPVDYLNSFDLNLNDVNSIGFKRSFFVSKGKPNFETIDLNSEWQFVLNNDWSDVGSHLCVCNAPEGSYNRFYSMGL